ncbi:hypothetical protein L873DRAFT_762831 [Choiromyces venosus 120613-1]|uniref:Secreted protein n=1 Tax=Choiromyces venosus 120613-1 TaxID=1336337 RepID=A0A3N4JQT7_9PEZI|nr:hypothetical protein L873DRAFT_762831 [Choiromyces venosus 120613-1]
MWLVPIPGKLLCSHTSLFYQIMSLALCGMVQNGCPTVVAGSGEVNHREHTRRQMSSNQSQLTPNHREREKLQKRGMIAKQYHIIPILPFAKSNPKIFF